MLLLEPGEGYKEFIILFSQIWCMLEIFHSEYEEGQGEKGFKKDKRSLKKAGLSHCKEPIWISTVRFQIVGESLTPDYLLISPSLNSHLTHMTIMLQSGIFLSLGG